LISAGLGLSSGADDDSGARASGFYGAAEYVFLVHTWVSLRPYAGLLLTFPEHSSCANGVTPCDVSARIGFAGGKIRFTIPIPYVAPFIELGAGMSVGSISTQDAARNETFGGITYHVPVGLGLSIGAKQKVDLALQYLFHPDQHEFGGAFALSFGWRLR
jgi:hypothetical protein